MPADLETCHFFPVEEFWDEAKDFFKKESELLGNLLSGISVVFEHVGGASIPGSLTKKDIDIQIIVQKKDLSYVIEQLKKYGQAKNLENWNESKAIFNSKGKKFSTDYLVSVSETDAERQYWEARDVLINNPVLLKKYNDLKHSFEGKLYKDYRPAKKNFWETIYKEQLNINDIR